jgi:hypothetical protein
MKEELELLGYKVLITHFAGLVKYVATNFFNWDGEKDELGRTLLQYVGTDVVRKQDENFWVNFIKNILKFFPYQWDYVIIPDYRFPNEKDLLAQEYNTYHVGIVRDDNVSNLTEEQKNHPSETSVNSNCADTVIQNDGSLLDLAEMCHETVLEIDRSSRHPNYYK